MKSTALINRSNVSSAPKSRRHNPYTTWRAATLIGVYVLMAIHIAHWKLVGKTLAPLELNEVMYTLEHGVVTAGFIFMSLAVLSVLIFGRFFCSWGCHILALQDLCEWLLRKMKIRPKPVRSRVLLLVPLGAMLYMFVWPQVPRLLGLWYPIESISPPLQRPTQWKWRILTDLDQGQWASFVTNDFWRNLPGPWVTILTFAVVGFIIVYLLGTRAFCTYACPYGAIFSMADRFAPGKIMAAGDLQDCAACGLCTAACQSNIRVHHELTIFGRVVSPACLKDLDCVAACPKNRVKYGFTAPSGIRSWRKHGRFGVPYDFSWTEDLLMAGVFVACLLIFRSLYDAIPFLLCLGIGGCLAYMSVLALRMFYRNDLRLNQLQLRRGGRMTRTGWRFSAFAAFALAFTAHSAVIRYHESRARSILQSMNWHKPDEAMLVQARTHLMFCEEWGLVRSPVHNKHTASVWLASQTPGKARPFLERVVVKSPMDHWSRMGLAATLLIENEVSSALDHLRFVQDSTTPNASEEQQRHVHQQVAQMIAEVHAALEEVRNTQSDSIIFKEQSP